MIRPFWVGFHYFSLPFGVTTRQERSLKIAQTCAYINIYKGHLDVFNWDVFFAMMLIGKRYLENMNTVFSS